MEYFAVNDVSTDTVVVIVHSLLVSARKEASPNNLEFRLLSISDSENETLVSDLTRNINIISTLSQKELLLKEYEEVRSILAAQCEPLRLLFVNTIHMKIQTAEST